MKNILKVLVIFILGTAGGIFADQILWPYFIERPLFYQYRLDQAPSYITERNEIIITENEALQNTFERVEKSVVAVRTITQEARIITGSGLVVTSDGLVITLSDLVPQGQKFSFFVDGKAPIWQVLKRDNNLALIKLEAGSYSTVGFAEFGSLRFGQRVFMVGASLIKGDLIKTINEGIIKRYDERIIETNILDNINGSPLFNINGELVGLVFIDSLGNVSALPVNVIREFLGF